MEPLDPEEDPELDPELDPEEPLDPDAPPAVAPELLVLDVDPELEPADIAPWPVPPLDEEEQPPRTQAIAQQLANENRALIAPKLPPRKSERRS